MAAQELVNIIEGIRQGDRDACLALYHRYYQQIFRAAYAATKNIEQSIQIVKAVYKKLLLAARDGAFEKYFDSLVRQEIREQLASLTAARAVASYERELSRRLAEMNALVRQSQRAGLHERSPYGKHSRPKRRPKRRLRGLRIALLVIAGVVLLWAIVGLLMPASSLPAFDLGYSWFNANLFPLF